jgi:SAM-dependent methyltransferase
MQQSGEHKVPEHGYGMGYQESVRIESRCLFGMEADEFYRRQIGLVLDEIPQSLYGDSKILESRKLSPDEKLPEGVKLSKKIRNAGMKLVDRFNLGLDSGKKVLDLAVGEGDTSRYLATTGAHIEARDIEPYLVERAKQRDSEVRNNSDSLDGVSRDIKGRISKVFGDVNYQHGNYAKTKESVGEAEQFDAISCLSRSFIYLGERENYVKALKDFYDLLVPGGKVILQSRKHLKRGDLPWSKEMGTSLGQTPEGHFCMTDEKTGTKFIWRTDQETRNLSDGVKQSVGSRYIEYADGTTKDLGEVISDDHLDFSNLDGVGDMLREAGFKNLRIKVENLSKDGTEIMFAIVAEKPQEKVVADSSLSLRDRVERLLG